MQQSLTKNEDLIKELKALQGSAKNDKTLPLTRELRERIALKHAEAIKKGTQRDYFKEWNL